MFVCSSHLFMNLSAYKSPDFCRRVSPHMRNAAGGSPSDVVTTTPDSQEHSGEGWHRRQEGGSNE